MSPESGVVHISGHISGDAMEVSAFKMDGSKPVSEVRDGGCLKQCFLGDFFSIQFCGDYFINHEIRIPIKQPWHNLTYVSFRDVSFSSSSRVRCVFLLVKVDKHLP